MEPQKFAAIDIGSNSIKLVIIEAAAVDSFNVILQERERIRLGKQTLSKKFLSASAILRTKEAILRFRSIVRSYGI